ncbi:MAG TPA: LysR substrate-binding domain-containing protein [Holophaga sp.]|nr:LysR substrate-binding domain-containing protein [Holophaga sp.]
MELRHLRYFVAVAETENYTQAAHRLHISQPSLSQRIKDLETELELTLFAHKGRGVYLTPAGQYFLVEARQMLDRLTAATDAAHRIERGEAGSLRLSVLEAFADVPPIPEFFRTLRAHLPGLHLKLVGLHSQAQYQAILEGKIDAGIVGHRPTEEWEQPLSAMPVKDIPIFAMLPEGHPLSTRSSLLLEDLVGQDFIWPEATANTSYWAVFREALKDRNWKPRITQEASSFATTRSLVAAGYGCALGISVPCHTPIPGIVLIPIQDIDLRIRLHLVWSPDNPSPALKRFLQVAEEVASRQETPNKP